MTRKELNKVIEVFEHGAQLNLPNFLNWIADRLVHVYKENPNVDFVLTLRNRAKMAEETLDYLRGKRDAKIK